MKLARRKGDRGEREEEMAVVVARTGSWLRDTFAETSVTRCDNVTVTVIIELPFRFRRRRQ